MNVCVFCGASPTADTVHLDLAARTGAALAHHGMTVVTGAGSHGMMGAVATAALEAGGKVIGIIPRFLFDREPPHPGINDMRVVDTMHERKAQMYEVADAFITLPGGFGTLDETVEVITWRQLSLHDKPIFLTGEHGFWQGVEATFDSMHASGFLSDRDRMLVTFLERPEDAAERLVSLE